MEIRDVIHGSIAIEPHELPVIDSRYFQRLRHIQQLGFGEYSFPSATHNRYIHSLGAMETATKAFDTLFGGPKGLRKKSGPRRLDLFGQAPKAHRRFRAVLRLAALLHDCGHGPLSHTSEIAMPPRLDLKLPEKLFPGASTDKSKATHEDYTLKLILDSGLTQILEKAGLEFGFKPLHVASLIDPNLKVDDDFFEDSSIDGKWDFRPVLQQLISSELDADRMDYLRRDSWYAGVTYGQFDFDWLVANLSAHRENGRVFLGLERKALYSFEDFLISRFHMFLMVYFHHKSVVFDEMLARYFASVDSKDYQLPSDIEAYVKIHDADLYAHLAKSSNPWARRISEKRPYRMLVELHSGMAENSEPETNQAMIARLKADLEKRKVDSIVTQSTGELSKYFRKPGHPIFVHLDNLYQPSKTLRLEQCTDLFTRYSEKRVISRIYVSPEDYEVCKNLGRSPGV
ncbi:MAG: HD domain-containing protein [Bdellovibrionales bacterium]|nr:HD domain-containing protein [Bdellovibrionales bacterium]